MKYVHLLKIRPLVQIGEEILKKIYIYKHCYHGPNVPMTPYKSF